MKRESLDQQQWHTRAEVTSAIFEWTDRFRNASYGDTSFELHVVAKCNTLTIELANAA